MKSIVGMLTSLLGLSASLMVWAAGDAGAEAGKTAAAPEPAKYETTAKGYRIFKVVKDSMTFSKEFPATVTGVHDVNIYPQVSGTITQICFREGEKVGQNQLLYIIDQAVYRANYDEARANVDSADAQMRTSKLLAESNTTLYGQKAVSSFERQKSENAYKSDLASLARAKAQLDLATNDLKNTEIRSPVAGRLGMSSIRVGTLVNPNMTSPLISVSDNSKVYAYFSLTENEMLTIARMNNGQYADPADEKVEVKFRLSDNTMFSETGLVDAMSGLIDSSTGAVTVRAVFNNPQEIMRSGSTGTVIFPITVNDGLVIPQTSTYELQDKIFVYKVVDGKAKATKVTLMSVDDGQHYVVTDGISEGDVIVAEGVGLLREGEEIQ